MITIGIIGSAGRGEDLWKLNPEKWEQMKLVTLELCQKLAENRNFALVSGGAAWCDSIATTFYYQGLSPELTIHLPCKFDIAAFQFEEGEVGGTANYYHAKFSENMGKTPFASRKQLAKAIEKGAKTTVSKGFHERNYLVAAQATHLIALTFGDGATLKDGGTMHTARSFIRRNTNKDFYHINLFDMQVYNPGKV